MPEPLTKVWEPSHVASTKIESFRRLANDTYNLKLETYSDLWSWSTTSLDDFWMLVWKFTKVKASIHPTFAIKDLESKRLTPSPKWFPEARLNFAQNILESPYAPKDEHKTPVLTMVREGHSEVEDVSLSQLRSRVGRLSNALRRAGVQRLDRVACVGSHSINTFVVFLAAASIGAIFTCCSPEMGEKGILDRFLQVKAKVLFADDWIVYNGKKISCWPKMDRVAGQLKKQAGLQVLVAMPRFEESQAGRLPNGALSLHDFVAGVPDSLSFDQVEFTHPLVVVYSSGTTGQPKCLVHTVGGVLLKQKVEQILCTEMDEDSVYVQYTTTNWIMYLYSVSGLLSGARSILYDGSPVYPSPRKFLNMLGHLRVTHFGTSAHYLSLLEQAGVDKADVASLGQLKVITSTGSVLTESQYYWVYNTFGPVQLSSIAGGTDIAGAFVGGAASIPVYAGWCQARTLGMKVQIFSDEGLPIETTGRPGELVCTAPFPSQPAFFWGDKDGSRYQSAYFEKFPGVWHQGDYVQMDPASQGIRFLGRSDGVLNPSGVRFGSAEIYNVMEAFPEIDDSLCIGRRRAQDRDEQVMLFVKMKSGHPYDQRLEHAIRARIRQDLSPRHVPKFIFETPEIPMTVNGKKTELPVKRIVSGETVTPSSTIINPNSLGWYKKFADLEDTQESRSKL